MGTYVAYRFCSNYKQISIYSISSVFFRSEFLVHVATNQEKRLKQGFPDHQIYTVRDLGWNGIAADREHTLRFASWEHFLIKISPPKLPAYQRMVFLAVHIAVISIAVLLFPFRDFGRQDSQKQLLNAISKYQALRWNIFQIHLIN